MRTIVKEVIHHPVVITVGRAPDNDIALPDAGQVSSCHAQFILFHNGHLLSVEDMESTNGTFVNGERIAAKVQQPITLDDRINLGSFQFDVQLLKNKIPDDCQPYVYSGLDASQQSEIGPVATPVQESVSAGKYGETRGEGFTPDPPQAGATQLYDISEGVDFSERIELDLTKDMISIGRAPENDIVLNFPQVSALHAILTKIETGFLVSDQKSTNGTFVNGRRIEACPVRDGDCIQLGSVRLEISKGGIQKYDQSRNVRLDVFDIVQRSPKKVYLNKTSFSIMPNEFVGLLAPSAAGKSTLMETITGMRKPSTGKVYFNNLDLYEHFDAFRQWIGYVPQDDIIHKELTVRQCLYFSAKLRLALNEDEINERIDNILKELELESVQHTQIGGRKERVSGGQRKRVSLGVELLAEPGFLFLDEPTTGLDPRTERLMMKLFRRLSDQGKTILCITHSMESLDQLDNIIFLSSGGFLSYYGPVADCYSYFGEKNPAHIFNHLEPEKAETSNDKYKRSQYNETYVINRLSSVNPHKNDAPQNMDSSNAKFLNFNQTGILTKRNLAIKCKDYLNTLMLLAQAPIIAFLLTIGFEKVTDALLLIISLSAIFFGCINSCREIVGEISIYIRERMLNLNLPAYLLSKVFVFSGFCFLQGLMFLAILYLRIDMGDKSPLMLFGLFFLTSFAGVSLGLLISALADTQEKAMYLVPIALLPQIIFSGGLFLLNGVSKVISYFTISRWSLKALKEVDTYFNAGCILLMAAILIGGTYFAMRRKDTNNPIRLPFMRKQVKPTSL